MRRETLEGYRRFVNKMDYHPSAERERQLIDSHLDALAEIERLRSDSCAYDCEHCHDLRDPHPDCPKCRTA
jgi:hypothetical protein